MAVVKAFRAFRPVPEKAARVAALPYDVMNSAEAKQMVQGNPYSFLHVDKAEVDLPEGTDVYSEAVYLKARENLDTMINNGVYEEDGDPCFYIYRQIMNGRAQTGLVCCTSVDDYLNNVIKKHEFTRAEKEKDRINHVDYCDANTGPIFLTYNNNAHVHTIIHSFVTAHTPVYDFEAEGVQNTVWVVDDTAIVSELSALFAGVDALYIADGHHRAASAVKVALKRRAANPDYTGDEEFNFFLAVLFEQSELEIMDYNRVVKDLNGFGESDFLKALSEKFELEEKCAAYKPESRHTFGLYLGEKWYKMSLKSGVCDESDPVARLDVSILQNEVLTPLLGIGDPREDKRIDFVGGIRGLAELEKRCREDMCLAFSMYPTSIEDLMAIADSGNVMPPKSTWFEPKLLSGLFIHKLS